MAILLRYIKNLSSNAFVLGTLIFLIGVLIVNPAGEFSINDDWIYLLSVEAFTQGFFRISSFIDTSGILHLLMGAGWAKLFGFSITSLRYLSIFHAVLTLFGVYLTLGLFNVTNTKKLAALLLIVANTLFFTSAMSFMTETSFLMFMVWSIYFFVRGERENNWVFLALGSVFAGASLLVRQVGIVIFIAYVISVVLVDKISIKALKKIILSVVICALFFAFWNFWPKHSEFVVGEGVSGLDDTLSNLINPAKIPQRIIGMFYIIFYFGYFFSPLFALFLNRLRKKEVVIISIAAVFIAAYIYKLDLFPIGNIFYIEALYAKTNFRNNFSLFDNILVKVLLSYFIAFFSIFMLYLLARISLPAVRKTLQGTDFHFVFFVFLMLGMTAVLLLGNDLYDRYFLPQFVILPLFALIELKGTKITRRFFILASLLFFVTVALQHDYAARTRLQWQHAYALQKDTGHITAIHVSSSYSHYVNAKRQNDLSINFLQRKHGMKPICFTQGYTLNSESLWQRSLEGVDDLLYRFVDNPRINDSTKDNSISRAKNNRDHFLYNDKYFSFSYALVGKQAYVGSWCID
jgi:hypothetical protein